MVAGYNVSLKIDGKTIVGRTSDSLNISAITKESITKDDAGVKKVAVTGHDVTFSVSALMELLSTTESTKMDRDDVIALALATGSAAEFTVLYVCGTGDTYTGTGIITGYTEDTAAEADADSTISLDIMITGAFTKQV